MLRRRLGMGGALLFPRRGPVLLDRGLPQSEYPAV